MKWLPIPCLAVPPESRRKWIWERTWPMVYSTLAVLFVASLLWLNVLDVHQFRVRLLYFGLAIWLLSFFLIRRFRVWKFWKEIGNQIQLPKIARVVDESLEGLLSVALLLVTLEAGARALPPMTDSSTIYPGVRFVWPEAFSRRNALGLTGEVPGPKRGLRVLVLGDSYVEGAGVRRQERFCSVLQESLKRHDPGAQVIAGGLCGWDTIAEARFLERHGEAIEPDLVLVCYVLNDAEGDRKIAPKPTAWEFWLLTKLRSYFCYRIFRWRSPPMSAYWAQVSQQHERDAPNWKSVEAALGQISTWCRQKQIPFQLAALPLFVTDADAAREVMEQVVERASFQGFHAYNTLDDFESRWGDFAISPYDAHPNAAGHARLADRMHRELKLSTSPNRP